MVYTQVKVGYSQRSYRKQEKVSYGLSLLKNASMQYSYQLKMSPTTLFGNNLKLPIPYTLIYHESTERLKYNGHLDIRLFFRY